MEETGFLADQEKDSNPPENIPINISNDTEKSHEERFFFIQYYI